jgi:DNA-directed RNA polymerase subunit RPC12/RpoP
MSDETTNQLCSDCGQAFSAFLNEMEAQNAKVVCPNCRAGRDCKSPEHATDEHAHSAIKPN